jgi:hydroxyacylglutathione hydrolase
MLQIKAFTFNDFYENTYVLYDDTEECIIIDPGCNTAFERDTLTSFIKEKNLKPVMLINTHCHIDHVLGNKYIADSYQLGLYAHEMEKRVLEAQPIVSMRYGISYETSPEITGYLQEGSFISFGSTQMKILFVPGHAPGHICLHDLHSETLIAGDALFKGSIGRTDLPGGDYDTLIERIKSELFTLPDVTTVYSGHGETTTIGIEKRTNPFFV